MARHRQNDPNPGLVKYLVMDNKGTFVIEVPADWKLTFGYVNPGKSSDGYGRGEGHCMRVWEGEKLRAVFGNCRGFRDLSLPLAREVRTETGNSSWTKDSEGNFSQTVEVNVEKALLLPEYVDEDEDEEEVGF